MGDTFIKTRTRLTILVLLVLVLGVVLRLWGIGKESFWTDEVLSLHLSRGGVSHILDVNARDSHPPLFYLGLAAWRTLVPDSNTFFRAYSTVWSLIGLVALFLLARDIGGYRAGIIALFLGIINPLDIYFAQETRMYAQAAALCVFSTWFLWRWARRLEETDSPRLWWKWAVLYGVSACAALYSHYIIVLVLLAQGIWFLAVTLSKKKFMSCAGYLAISFVVCGMFLPWMLYVISLRRNLYNVERLSWIGTPEITGLFSFLGKECMWGQVVHVHYFWWVPTLLVPVALLVIAIFRVFQHSGKEDSTRQLSGKGIVFLLVMLFAPVVLAFLVSIIYEPVYYRQRFSLFTLAPFLALAGISISSFKRRTLILLTFIPVAALMVAGSIIQYRTAQKEDWKAFKRAWDEHAPPARTVFFPHHYLAAARHNVSEDIYHANRVTLERDLPRLQGKKIWIIKALGQDLHGWDETSLFYNWLYTLGEVTSIMLPTMFNIESITVGKFNVPDQFKGRFDKWYSPSEITRIFHTSTLQKCFYEIEKESESVPIVWSRPRAMFRLFDTDNISTAALRVQFPPPLPEGYRPDLYVYIERGMEMETLFESEPCAFFEHHQPGIVDVQCRIPEGDDPILIGWTINGVNPAREGITGDTRDLGLLLRGVGLIRKEKLHPVR